MRYLHRIKRVGWRRAGIAARGDASRHLGAQEISCRREPLPTSHASPLRPHFSGMSFLRHLTRLLRDVVGFARENKAWWIVPLMLLLLIVGGLIVGVSSISPFIYSLF